MKTKLIGAALLSAVPLAVAGGWIYANSRAETKAPTQQASSEGYICPVTGEELPCPECCPYKNEK
jgi:hypothetical protein